MAPFTITSRCNISEEILQGANADIALLHGADRLAGGATSRHGGVIGNVVGQRGVAQRETVLDRTGTLGGVQHQLDFARQHGIDRMWPAFHHLVDPGCRHAGLLQRGGGATGGNDREAGIDQITADRNESGLVLILDRDEDGSLGWQPCP